MRLHPRQHRAAPEGADGRAVWADQALVGHARGGQVKDVDFHGDSFEMSGIAIFVEAARHCLTGIADRLIWIALVAGGVAVLDRCGLAGQPVGGVGAPGGRRAAELLLEGTGEGFAGTEAGGERRLQYRFAGAGQAKGGFFQAPAAQVVAQRFAHPGGEDAVEMKAREVGHIGQLRQLQRLVQVLVDVIEHAVHAPRIFGARGL